MKKFQEQTSDLAYALINARTQRTLRNFYCHATLDAYFDLEEEGSHFQFGVRDELPLRECSKLTYNFLSLSKDLVDHNMVHRALVNRERLRDKYLAHNAKEAQGYAAMLEKLALLQPISEYVRVKDQQCVLEEDCEEFKRPLKSTRVKVSKEMHAKVPDMLVKRVKRLLDFGANLKHDWKVRIGLGDVYGFK